MAAFLYNVKTFEPSNIKMLKVNGHSLNLETHGPADGPPVVLLHHGLGSIQAWKYQIPALVQAGWRVVVYDRWGYGKSAPRPGTLAPDFQEDLADLLEILNGIKIERTALVGHSDGGTIALYFAAQHPQRVTCLVSVAAHIYVENKVQPGIAGVRQAFLKDERFRSGLRRAHGDKFEALFDYWFTGWDCPENASWDMRPALKGIGCPTLVVQGLEDEHATPQHARDLAAGLPGAELWLEPGAGHMLPQEQPEKFNARLLEFIRTHQ
jgi:pimeloyl-ACP methyl ester carboxylesterase